jgi:hypothetical protein
MADGHGGRRPGAGRKRKADVLRFTAAVGSHHRQPAPNPEAMVADLEHFDPPADLPEDVCKVWLMLAPLAFKRRTLTRTTEFSFERLCQNLVLTAELEMRA